jgi:hypothetical protein
MSLLRYNWLRKRGYHTIRGANYLDPDFGDEWVELVMSNGKRIKRVKVNGSMSVAEYKEIEAALAQTPKTPTP